MESLPGEVLSNIFIRLLAKQLAQMRCVCKSWNALLSESFFIKSHLHRSIHHNDKILLFFRWDFSFDCSSSPFTARNCSSPDLEVNNFIKLPINPHLNKYGRGSVVGSVNGLICFIYGLDPFRSHDYAVYIWNPSLSVVLTLPPWYLHSDGDDLLVADHFRFGFDPKSDDYKVVKLSSIFQARNKLQKVEVYSMRKGSWDLITRGFPQHIRKIMYQPKLCVDGQDGHLYWHCQTDLDWKPETIVAFDLDAETFREIPLPDSILHQHRYQGFNVLGVLAGKLCVMSCVVEGGNCEVWVMDEFGVADSWIKHHAFSQFGCRIYPCGFTLHNEFLCEVDRDHYALYDPITDKPKTFRIIPRLHDVEKFVEYVDSLVWVKPAEREMSCYNIS